MLTQVLHNFQHQLIFSRALTTAALLSPGAAAAAVSGGETDSQPGKGSSQAAPGAQDGPVDPGEADREVLRERHHVRLVSDEEEGAGVSRLPAGVYGFTYSPGASNFPLFRKRASQSFEVHKLADESLAIIGFLPRETAAKVMAGESLHISLMPDPAPEPSQAVSIPLGRASRIRELSMRQGKGLEMDLESRWDSVAS